MLKLNLSTRPFYNERAVHAAIGAITLLVIAFTTFNVVRIVTLSREQGRLASGISELDVRAKEQRRQAQAIRAGIDNAELTAVAGAARDANAIIEARVFSWSAVLDRFEETLPADVRILSVRPSVDRDGPLRIALIVEGRRAQDVDDFVRALEETGAFRDLTSRQEFVNQDGLLETTLEGEYVRQEAAARDAAPAGGR